MAITTPILVVDDGAGRELIWRRQRRQTCRVTDNAIGVKMLTLREALQNAERNKFVLGHFNVSDLSGLHAVVRAGRRLNLPFMIGVSEGEREFLGLKEIALLVRIAREEYGQSLYLNADHTHSLEKAEAAAEAGFDEVIFDSSPAI